MLAEPGSNGVAPCTVMRFLLSLSRLPSNEPLLRTTALPEPEPLPSSSLRGEVCGDGLLSRMRLASCLTRLPPDREGDVGPAGTADAADDGESGMARFVGTELDLLSGAAADDIDTADGPVDVDDVALNGSATRTHACIAYHSLKLM